MSSASRAPTPGPGFPTSGVFPGDGASHPRSSYDPLPDLWRPPSPCPSSRATPPERPSVRLESPISLRRAGHVLRRSRPGRRHLHDDIKIIDDSTYAWSASSSCWITAASTLLDSSTSPRRRAISAASSSLVLTSAFTTSSAARRWSHPRSLAARYYLILRGLEASPRVALLGALSMASTTRCSSCCRRRSSTDVPTCRVHALALLDTSRRVGATRRGCCWSGGLSALPGLPGPARMTYPDGSRSAAAAGSGTRSQVLRGRSPQLRSRRRHR